MIQKIISIVASITLIGSASLTVYADNILYKGYIVSEIWSNWWHGKGDDELIFPEASYKCHILTEQVNDNYGNVINSFMSFRTLTEDTAEKKHNSVIADDGNRTAYRVGENLKIEEDTTIGVSEEATESTNKEKFSNGLIYGIVRIILAGIAVLAGFLIKKKRG